MFAYKDKTFCGSLKCKNKCGRKMTDKEYQEWNDSEISTYVPISYADFCDENGELLKWNE